MKVTQSQILDARMVEFEIENDAELPTRLMRMITPSTQPGGAGKVSWFEPATRGNSFAFNWVDHDNALLLEAQFQQFVKERAFND